MKIHINRPHNPTYTQVGPPKTKWCFKCRKHQPHKWVVFHDDSEHGSWYEPVGGWKCPKCKGDYSNPYEQFRPWGI